MTALLLAALLTSQPSVTRLRNGDYYVPSTAWAVLDGELKRLQAVEKNHEAESWLGVFGVGALVGAGAVLAVVGPLLFWSLGGKLAQQGSAGP